MFCPKCGNEMDIFADKCLKCGKSFKNISIAERKKLEFKPRIKQKSQKRNKRVRKIPKIEATPIRITYDNGIPVGEGMSITGTKQKRGAHRPFLYKF